MDQTFPRDQTPGAELKGMLRTTELVLDRNFLLSDLFVVVVVKEETNFEVARARNCFQQALPSKGHCCLFAHLTPIEIEENQNSNFQPFPSML